MPSPIADILTTSRLGCAARPGSPGSWRNPADDADNPAFGGCCSPVLGSRPVHYSMRLGISVTHIAGQSESCRYCCKSPKLPGANFLAVKKFDRRPPIDVAPITLPRSPASLSSGNEAPHIFTRKSRVQPKEILITSAKRLLQQNLPIAASCTATTRWQVAMIYSITSSARAMRVGGTVTPIADAVRRLMISSNSVASCTGRSLGLAPFSILST
jgi:hypothetical protein